MPKLTGGGIPFPVSRNQPNQMTITDDKLTATQARHFAKRILAETHFTNVKVRKGWGGWEIAIDGGREACYGRTASYADTAEDILRIFAND